MAMTDEQRILFQANGFLNLPGALTGFEFDRVQEAAEEAEALFDSDPSRLGSRSPLLKQIQTPIEYGDTLLGLLWHPVVFPIVREILGSDVMMIDNDFFVTPPKTKKTHAHWHHDVNMRGVYHPLSVMMVKVFYLLTDVNEDSGGTAMVPGSHRFPEEFRFPDVDDPKDMPGSVQMTGKAGDAYLFNGRVYHCAVNNTSNHSRKVLIYNYGHFWMKMWHGYEPSQGLLDEARRSEDPVRKQLLGIGPPYEQTL